MISGKSISFVPPLHSLRLKATCSVATHSTAMIAIRFMSNLYLTVEKVTDSLHRSFTLVPSFGLAANDKRREEVCFTYEPLLAVLFCRVLQCPNLRPLPFLRRKGFSFWSERDCSEKRNGPISASLKGPVKTTNREVVLLAAV